MSSVTISIIQPDADSNSAHLAGNAFEGDPLSFCPKVWEYLIERFGVKSVLDLGSGLGYAALWFARKGIYTIAAEGFKENVENSLYPAVLHDLTTGPIRCRVDLVHCQEVVEHIEEKYIDNLLASLCNGRVVVITHAVPGQGGHHHVNEQNSDYWIQQFDRYGYNLLVHDSNHIRQLSGKEGYFYMARSALVFHKKAL